MSTPFTARSTPMRSTYFNPGASVNQLRVAHHYDPFSCLHRTTSPLLHVDHSPISRIPAAYTVRANSRPFRVLFTAACPSLEAPSNAARSLSSLHPHPAGATRANRTTSRSPRTKVAMAEQQRLAYSDHSHSHSHSHSHGFGLHHHHHHDNTFLVSKNKNDAAVKITKIGLYVNICMAVSKGVGGYVFHSQALIADAVHSLADLVSDVMTLATVTWSSRQPTTRFPLGYGKIESLGSLGVSGLLLGGGIMMGWAAIVALCQQFFPDIAHAATEWGIFSDGHGHGHGHSHSHSHTDLPNINAAWLAGGSIIIKEWLYRATLKVAKERKSSVLASNAYHHRVDSLTAFVALLTIGGSNFLSNAAWLDPVGGLAISTMVVQAGYMNTRQALLELADVGVDQETKSKVERSAQKALRQLDNVAGSEAVAVRNVTGMKSGQNYLMDLELIVPGDWSVEQSRQLEDVVRDRVSRRVRGVKRLRVRFATQEEVQDGLLSNEFVNSDSEAEQSPEAGSGNEHDHHHTEHGEEKINGAMRK